MFKKNNSFKFYKAFFSKSLIAFTFLLTSLHVQADFLKVSFTGTILSNSDVGGQFFPNDLSKPDSLYIPQNDTYFNTAVGDAITGNFYINLDILPPDEADSSTQGLYLPDYPAFNNDPNVVVSFFTYNGVTVSTEQSIYSELSDTELINTFDTGVNIINSFDQFIVQNAEKDGQVSDTFTQSILNIALVDDDRTMLTSDLVAPFVWTKDSNDDNGQGDLLMWHYNDSNVIYDYRAIFDITEANATIVSAIVPIPPVLILFLSGLLPLGIIAKRRRR